MVNLFVPTSDILMFRIIALLDCNQTYHAIPLIIPPDRILGLLCASSSSADFHPKEDSVGRLCLTAKFGVLILLLV